MIWIGEGLVRWWRWHSKPKPVTGLNVTFTQSLGGNMERYKLTWIPSQSTFIDKLVPCVSQDDGATFVQLADLPPSTTELLIDVATGAKCGAYIKAVGDNGKAADSDIIAWTAVNEEVPLPVTGLAKTWVSHSA